jgi:NAD(P)-dependent dehydrogenase (short-subunit alcohol dehydrogenase family)
MPRHRPTVLITSGTTRLGLALALEAVEQGWDVVAHYRSKAAPLQRALRDDPTLRSRINLLQADITVENAAEVFDHARALSHNIQGLVNNASSFVPSDLTDQQALRDTLNNNALVPSALAQAFYAHTRSGWIVNITDAHVAPLNRRFQNYRIAKLLLSELTRQQAFAYAPRVRVNAIAPGPVLPARGVTPAQFRSLAATTPLGRATTPAAVRRAFAYLLNSPDVTGQTLFVDSGWHLRD